MAGGEFRLGTDSIYMADDGHIRPKGTSPKFWITWLRFQRKIRGCRVFSAAYAHRKKEARAKRERTHAQPTEGRRRSTTNGAQHRGLSVREPDAADLHARPVRGARRLGIGAARILSNGVRDEPAPLSQAPPHGPGARRLADAVGALALGQGGSVFKRILPPRPVRAGLQGDLWRVAVGHAGQGEHGALSR